MKQLKLIVVMLTIFTSFIAPTKAGAIDLPVVATALQAGERVSKMKVILEKYNSPMVGNEAKLIEIAESKGLDWTLMAAIAGTESSFGRRMPANCLNQYGWGIYGDNKLCFESYEKAASAVAEGLSKKYNTTSIETIARTYNKVSTEGWITHTKFFMNKIKNAEVPVHALPITL